MTMSNDWMTSVVKRLALLEKAIDVHRELIQGGEMPRDAVDAALWRIYDWRPGCTGGCCG
jgi:hypothetical protein